MYPSGLAAATTPCFGRMTSQNPARKRAPAALLLMSLGVLCKRLLCVFYVDAQRRTMYPSGLAAATTPCFGRMTSQNPARKRAPAALLLMGLGALCKRLLCVFHVDALCLAGCWGSGQVARGFHICTHFVCCTVCQLHL